MAANSGGISDPGGGTRFSASNIPLDASEFSSIANAGETTKRRKDMQGTQQSLGPRYVIIKPLSSKSPISDNPFRLAADIDKLVGKVLDVKRLRSGEILVKTQTSVQAAKLIKCKQLPISKTSVIIEDYSKLNHSKGKIFHHDLKALEYQEILEGFKSDNVIEVYRQKQRNKQGNLEDSGVFILTFNKTILPNYVSAGYSRIKVTPYIPNPMRCAMCLEYGHTQKYCKATQKICAKCGQTTHDGDCDVALKCINCVRAKMNGDLSHSVLSRSCPIFKKEYEIQKIRTLNNVTLREAQNMYRALAPALNKSFAETTKKKCNCVCKCNMSTTNTNHELNIPKASTSNTNASQLSPKLPIVLIPKITLPLSPAANKPATSVNEPESLPEDDKLNPNVNSAKPKQTNSNNLSDDSDF